MVAVGPESRGANPCLKVRDRIGAINVQRSYIIRGDEYFIRDHPGEPLTFTVERDGKEIPLQFNPGSPRMASVARDCAADRGGLKQGDVIVAVDGRKIASTLAISDYIKQHADQPIAITVQRGAEQRTVNVTPEVPVNETTPRIGISWDEDYGMVLDAYGKLHITHPSPFEQIRAGTLSIFNTVGAIVSPKSDVRLQHMSGPVMMLRVYYVMFENKEGWRMALWFSVVLNVNLALLNLLPIPVLDGGHITLALVEAVRRRPVNIRALEVVQTACAVLIIGFMVYIAFFDVQDLFGGRRDTPKFLPKATPGAHER